MSSQRSHKWAEELETVDKQDASNPTVQSGILMSCQKSFI
jgi:hypothetical protein